MKSYTYIYIYIYIYMNASPTTISCASMSPRAIALRRSRLRMPIARGMTIRTSRRGNGSLSFWCRASNLFSNSSAPTVWEPSERAQPTPTSRTTVVDTGRWSPKACPARRCQCISMKIKTGSNSNKKPKRGGCQRFSRMRYPTERWLPTSATFKSMSNTFRSLSKA